MGLRGSQGGLGVWVSLGVTASQVRLGLRGSHVSLGLSQVWWTGAVRPPWWGRPVSRQRPPVRLLGWHLKNKTCI